MPALARSRVRFIGETVAVAAAVDPDLAEDALALIDVEYEPVARRLEPARVLLEPDIERSSRWAPTRRPGCHRIAMPGEIIHRPAPTTSGWPSRKR
jgi:hypothetical protein